MLLTKKGFFSVRAEVQFWNYLLLISFLLTAGAGLILALEKSYAVNIPGLQGLLVFHAETGIAFSFTAIFHIIRHLRYFTGRSSSVPKSGGIDDSGQAGNNRLPGGNIFFLGFFTSALQLLVLREIMNISGGYELIAGTYFATWLILSAAGAFSAGTASVPDIKTINIFLFLSPLITLLLFIVTGNFFLLPGETPGYYKVLIFTIAVLSPACFISGYAFVRLTVLSPGPAGKSYATETAGGIVAGLSVAGLTSGVANTFTIWAILSAVAIACLWFYYPGRKTFFVLAYRGAAIIAIIMLPLVTPFDAMLRNCLIHGIKITESKDSKYGNISTGYSAEEKTIFYNHSLAVYEHDVSDREEGVHFAMLQHPYPDNILVISGSLPSIISEVSRYGKKKVTFIERDPQLVKTAYTGSNSSWDNDTDIIFSDAFSYVKDKGKKFDVVMMHLPPPSTLALSRYFSREFFTALKGRMTSGAVLACSPGSYSAYGSDKAVRLYSSISNTLGLSFHNVVPIQGNRLWFIASDSALSTSITALARERQIATPYIGGGYIDDSLLQLQTERLSEILKGNGEINTLMKPAAVFFYQRYALSMYNMSTLLPIALTGLVIVLSLIKGGRGSLAMFAAAAALAGFELIALLMMQSTAGNIYHATGIITSSVLGGLALGSWHGKRNTRIQKKHFTLLTLGIVYLLVAAMSATILRMNPCAATPLIAVISLVPSFYTGMFYAVLAEKDNKYNTVSIIYGSDLTGAAMGFLLTSALAVPLLGIGMTMVVLALLVFIAYPLATLVNK